MIREFKNTNPTSETHIRVTFRGKSTIPSSLPFCTTNKSSLPMSHVYYTQSPGQIYAQELAEGLLSYKDATQLCIEKYKQEKHLKEELTVTTPITAEELQLARDKFPKPAKILVSSGPLLPLV